MATLGLFVGVILGIVHRNGWFPTPEYGDRALCMGVPALPLLSAAAELLVVNVVAQHDPQPDTQFVRRCNPRLAYPFLDKLATIEAFPHLALKLSLDGFELRDHWLLRSDPPCGEGSAFAFIASRARLQREKYSQPNCETLPAMAP